MCSPFFVLRIGQFGFRDHLKALSCVVSSYCFAILIDNFIFVFRLLFDWLGGTAALEDARRIIAISVLPVFFAFALYAAVKTMQWQKRVFWQKKLLTNLVLLVFLGCFLYVAVTHSFISEEVQIIKPTNGGGTGP